MKVSISYSLNMNDMTKLLRFYRDGPMKYYAGIGVEKYTSKVLVVQVRYRTSKSGETDESFDNVVEREMRTVDGKLGKNNAG